MVDDDRYKYLHRESTVCGYFEGYMTTYINIYNIKIVKTF